MQCLDYYKYAPMHSAFIMILSLMLMKISLVCVDVILCNKDFIAVFYYMGAIFKLHVMHAAFTSSSLYLLMTLTHMCSWLWQLNK